jgi:hypothetical protein
VFTGETLLASYLEQVAIEHDLLISAPDALRSRGSAGGVGMPRAMKINYRIPPRALAGLGSHFRETDHGTRHARTRTHHTPTHSESDERVPALIAAASHLLPDEALTGAGDGHSRCRPT